MTLISRLIAKQKEVSAMRKKDNALIWILLIALVLCVALGLHLDPGTQMVGQPVGDYQVLISEICAKNETIIADNDGKYRDYIELYNPGPKTDLTGCRLTDGSVSYRFDGLVLDSGEYRLLFLGSETTGFALSASGRDSVQLQDPAGNIISQTKLRSVNADQVMVFSDGVWLLSDQPSPGFSNDDTGQTAFRTGTAADSLSLQISEVLIANKMSMPDEKGVFSDVVELHNPTDMPVCLSGWYLSDSIAERFRFRLPDLTLPAGGYLLVHCDGENYLSESGIVHANFALTAQEELCLTDPSGAYISVCPQYNGNDISLALTEAGYQLMTSSLGFANTEQGCSDASQARIDPESPLVISEVVTGDSGVPYEGKIGDVVEVWNCSNESVRTAHWYLSDGSDAYAYALPEVSLAPGERLVLPLSQKTAGFALSDDEVLYLMSPEYMFSQPVACSGILPGRSISLLGEGSQQTYGLAGVSLGCENTQEGACQFQESAAPKGLQLSEAVSANDSYLPGPYGNTTDWVELYNAGDTDVRLSDYCLTDADNRQQYPLPDKTLKPGAYTVILLSEDEKNLRKGYSWLPLSLSAGGDGVYLTRNGVIEDYLILPELSGDTAWGRPLDKQYAAQLTTPTPERKNSEEALISQIPVADLPQGAYNDVTGLTISFSGPGQIYYTTDCTVPTQKSELYTGPIQITSTTVFRVVAYEDGCVSSPTLDLTYLLNEGDTLTSVCVVTEPNHLWNYETGIYSTGANAQESFPYYGANYWKNVEKPATISLFEADGSLGFSESCGLKIFGGFSRAQSKKSFACMFRSKYGKSSLDYALFGDGGLNSFQSFVLRAGGQDAYVAKFRDEMITSLASDYLGLPVQQYRPVVLYLNGEYWGIYFIREKLSDQYVAGNFNAHSEDVVLTQQSGASSTEYMELKRYAQSHDLSEPEYYEYVCSQINVDNYIDYVITQLWIENTDLGNVKFFKTAEIPWHWALFDTDVSMYDPGRDSVRTFLSKGSVYSSDLWSQVLVVRLLQNPQFRDTFLRRMAWQLKNVWNEAVVVERIDQFYALLKNDIEKECTRWGPSVAEWEENVQVLRDFAAARNSSFVSYVQSFFNLTDKQMRDYGFEV